MDFNEFQNSDKADLIEEISRAAKINHKAHSERKKAEAELAAAHAELDLSRLELAQMNVFQQVKDTPIPPWLTTPKDSGKVHHGTPFLMLSDLHLDEVVDLVEMDHLNEYNRQIAEKRLNRVIEGTIEFCERNVNGLTLDGIVCALGGDIITGEIHDELAATNEAPVPDTIVYWAPILASALKRLADHFGSVFVPCVDGNHDRMYKKMRMKKRATSSYSYIIYNMVKMLCADDDRITVHVSKSPEYIFDIYETTFMLDHGDKFRGGGGVGGIYPPMLKWLAKKMNVPGRGFDIAVVGHWHQTHFAPGIFVNGSTKGYDEYARNNGFGYERPQQILFFTTPENGVIIRTQIYAD